MYGNSTTRQNSMRLFTISRNFAKWRRLKTNSLSSDATRMRQLAGGPHVGLGQAARAAELTVVYVRKMCRGASATLMHAAIHANTPRYLADRVSAYNPSRYLRSADLSLVVVPRVNSERFGRRAFSVAGPSLWNSLPLVLRTQKDDERFRRDLKTHLYKQTFM